MSYWSNDDDVDEIEDGDRDEEEYRTQNDRTIFLIDGDITMFRPNLAGELHVRNVLHFALEYMKLKIVECEKSSVGLVFFNTNAKGFPQSQTGAAPDTNSNGIIDLFPLEQPSAQRIRDLQVLISNETLLRTALAPRYGDEHVTDMLTTCPPIKQALWHCEQSFCGKGAKNNDLKRIWIFTNNDRPYSVLSPASGGDTSSPQIPVSDRQQLLAQEEQATLTVARDCAQAGTDISLWHIDPTPMRPFDVDGFYTKLLRASLPTTGTATGTATSACAEGNYFDGATTTYMSSLTNSSLTLGGGTGMTLEEEDEYIQQHVEGAGNKGFDIELAGERRKRFAKRRLGAILFHLGPYRCYETGTSDVSPGIQAMGESHLLNSGVSSTNGTTAGTGATIPVHSMMAVTMYKNIQMAKKPQYTWLYSVSNEPCRMVSTFYDTATGERIVPDQIITYLDVQGGKVPISKEEITFARTAGNVSGVGLQLLYFVPRRSLPLRLQEGSFCFLFPDEAAVTGSSVMFESLLRDLSAKDLIAVVRLNRTLSAAPQFCAMLPQLEELTADGDVLQYAGFHVISLPFSDDIRYTPAPPPPVDVSKRISHYRKELFTPGHMDMSLGSNTSGKHQGGEVSDPLAATMLKILSVLSKTDDYDYTRDIRSPSMQQYYAVLEALALGKDISSSLSNANSTGLSSFVFNSRGTSNDNNSHSEIRSNPLQSHQQDATMQPDNNVIDQYKDSLFKEFQTVAGLDDENVVIAVLGVKPNKKRATPAGAAGAKGIDGNAPVGKKAKQSKGSSDASQKGFLSAAKAVGNSSNATIMPTTVHVPSMGVLTCEEIQAWANSGLLEKLDTEKLKSICSQLLVGTSGNKKSMVDRIATQLRSSS